MFTIDNNVSYDTKTGWTPDTKVNGMRFASIPKALGSDEIRGVGVVCQYLESLRYRLHGSEQIPMSQLSSTILPAAKQASTNQSATYPSLKGCMNAAVNLGYIVGTTVRFCNDITTLKWFMHEYKQCLVELKHTSTTSNPSSFDLTTGSNVNSTLSVGYMMYGYDANYVILQGAFGMGTGCGSFHRITWSDFNTLFIKAAVFGIQ